MFKKLNKLGEYLFEWFEGEDHLKIDFASKKKGRALAESFEFSSLKQTMIYDTYNIEKKIFLNKASMGFVLELAPIIGSDDKLEADLRNFTNEIMEENSYVQVLLLADSDIDRELRSWGDTRIEAREIFKKIAEKRIEFIKNLNRDGVKLPYRDFRIFISYSTKRQNKDREDKVLIERLAIIKEKFIKILNNYTSLIELDAERLINLVNKLLYPVVEKEIFKKEWSMLDPIGEQVHSNGYCHQIHSNYIRCDEELAFKSFAIEKYPKIFNLSMISNLLGDLFNDYKSLNFPFCINYMFHKPDQGPIYSKFNKDIALVEYQAKSFFNKFVPNLKEEFEEYNISRELLNKDSCLLKTNMSICIWAHPDKISEAEEQIKTIYRGSGFKLSNNKYIHFPHYLSILPLWWSEQWHKEVESIGFTLKSSVSTEPACLMPLQGEFKGTESEGILLQGRLGQIVKWSPFDNPSGNYNSIVVGKSGSGKSVFMQELASSIIGNKGRVFILDVGRSFEKTAKLLGGQFIEFSIESGICLNPFSNINSFDAQEEEENLRMISSLLGLMVSPLKGINELEKGWIERVFREVWAKYKNNSTIDLISESLFNTKDEVAKNIAIKLTQFTSKGAYGKIFNLKNNVDFNNEIVLIELSELKGQKELQTVILQMFVATITNIMMLGDRKTNFAIIIDEAWDLLESDSAGGFIETLARRLRKYKGALITGTQGVNDYFKSGAGMAAFENSDWMCLLSQKKESIEALKKSGRILLDSQMETMLKSLRVKKNEYSEVMIYGSDFGYSINRLILDRFTMLLYSTDAKEYALAKDLIDSGMSIEEALEKMEEDERNQIRLGHKSNNNDIKNVKITDFREKIILKSEDLKSKEIKKTE
jgi:conjugal transfer ATP-binding protein TraC